MTGARILALGGTLAAALAMVGGFTGIDRLVGVSGAIMLTANVVVLFSRERTAQPAQPRATAVIANCTTSGDLVCIARSES